MNKTRAKMGDNISEMNRLIKMGFEIGAGRDSYEVRFKGKWVGGASIKLPRSKPLRGLQGQICVAENLESAILTAKRSKFYAV